MSDTDIPLMAHLMRRAGFGATRDELEVLAVNGYDTTVDELLHPEDAPDVAEDLLHRYDPGFDYASNHNVAASHWLYRMINTMRPLEEKMALFCHGLFATGGSKVAVGRALTFQVQMFRRHALGDFRTLLVELSKDPAMLFWLDNAQSHRAAVNENYGRELLELFSMGEGNYTEEDVKSAARAFTGWAFVRPMISNTGVHQPDFVFLPDDHDDDEKQFLGETGRFNGEDIVDIIVSQPATAQFVAARLYNFFVADEPDQKAIDSLARVFVEADYDMCTVMRALFMSDFFKNARFAKVKSPVEIIVSVSRMVGQYVYSEDGVLSDIFPASGVQQDTVARSFWMGQELLNPPSVEGWHTGLEWIDSGTVVERVNAAASAVGDKDKIGVRSIIDRLGGVTKPLEPAQLVDACLDLVGPFNVSDATREGLVKFVGASRRAEGDEAFEDTVVQLLQLVVATPEYQLG